MWLATLKLVFLILSLIRFATGNECLPDEFDCGNDKCIFASWVCDDSDDCGNGNDEKECGGKTTVVNSCGSTLFQCKSGECIPESWRCDGDPNCEDGSDEEQCGISSPVYDCDSTKFQCKSDGLCFDIELRCNGYVNCEDKSDEQQCDECSGFKCQNQECIFAEFHCDGKEDCSDGSDEMSCSKGDTCENRNCSYSCRSSQTGTECFCPTGYELDTNDNETCNSIESLLLFSTLKEVRVLNLKSGEQFNVRRTENHANAVDVNQRNGRIYWVELSRRSIIYSSEKDGSNLDTVLIHGLQIPTDIAVDYVANNIYITDSGLKQVLACRMEGNLCHVLHDTEVKNPHSIELDLKRSTMYWSDHGEQRIYRSGMDGSDRISFVTTNIQWPTGIAIDHTTDRLYWADAILKNIQYITLDRMDRKVVQKFFVYFPTSLTVSEDNIYWVDLKTNTIEYCDKFNGLRLPLMENHKQSTITGLEVYQPVLAVNAGNPCLSSGCQHMCLLSPVKGFLCVCSRGFNLAADQKTCIGKVEHILSKECNENDFKCQNGICLQANQRCNGIKDCEDGSDESNCMESLDSAIFISEGSSVFYIRPESLDRDNLTKLSLPLDNVTITRVAFDSNSQYLFVADIHEPAIFAINLTSSQKQVLVQNEIKHPQDLSFDWSSNNLYWIDLSKKTAEVVNVYRRKTVILLTELPTPVALAISPSRGHMFIATSGTKPAIIMYGMDGRNRKVLYFPGSSLAALHATKDKLFWSHYQKGTIFYANYKDLNKMETLKTGIYGVMSLAANENYVYYTAKKRELHVLKVDANLTVDASHVLKLPGQDIISSNRRITYSPGRKTETSKCLKDNGGCSYVCLTSPKGRTCACPSGMLLDKEKMNCIHPSEECDLNEFRCQNGRCLRSNQRCDGVKDCEDESDESNCSDQCKNMACSHHCENTRSGPRCSCNEGFNLDMRDKKTCIDINECLKDGFCSQKCLNLPGGYECSCLFGYELVNRTCKATGPDALLFFSTIREIRGVELNSMREIISTPARGRAITFDVHPKNLQMYWVEMSDNESIVYAENDNRNPTSILRHGNRFIKDIAVDYVANNLYITDMKFKEVLVCRLDGAMCHVLHDTEIGAPHSIALDLDSGLMYWSDWDTKFVGIYRSGMDGTRRISLVSDNITRPYGITLDRSAERLYWADVSLNTIEFVTLNGSLRKVILKSKEYRPYAVAVFEDSIFWSDESTLLVNSCNKFSGENVKTVMQSSYSEIRKMRLYHALLWSKASNPCENVCSHMCLISPYTGYLCVCPSGFKLSKDKRTCANGTSCNHGEVWCSPRKMCIPKEYICDGKYDCLDGIDEKHCGATTTVSPNMSSPIIIDGTSCNPEEVWCSPRKMCIPKEYICDGKDDCLDGIDEKYCDATTTVSPNASSPIVIGEKGNELIFMAEGPNIFVSVPNATGYHLKSLRSSFGSKAMITSLSYDSKSEKLFVSEAYRPAIYVLSTGSGVVRELVVNHINYPKDIDFDWLSNNLYWVDSSKGTVEVISVNNMKRIVILKNLTRPVSIALSPHSGDMFVSTIGDENRITMYGMDGQKKRIIHPVQGVPLSLVLHPTKTILYWTDSRAGMIMYVDYTGSSSPWILKSGINGVMSVAVDEDNVYWTAKEMTNSVVAGKIFVNLLSDQTDQTAWKSIVLSKRKRFSGKSECLTDNGGCSYLCLTSQTGRTCSCSSEMTLANDGKMCLGKRCEKGYDFRCSDGECIPSKRKCDGSIECNDGSDELNCTKPKLKS